ncbi:hypothetical protein NHX12_003940 [Muraenolepis orangiensis]|uniref:IRF tryptophan pentad repeat domain-containing protein n=1 Tax=Muraenolepis orangiensis TaxID=630683 RepID=A0A9Q0DW46_9TELE|nr:hypothetical protein NHX12_003940 [Muraenolepis orangiensis]
MNLEEDVGLTVSCGNGKLRQWLIDQIDSRSYQGLVWENDEKSIFRIPWKHAGKQDYNREEDAALFKAWALFKGKHKEGVDKPDPPTWKTRLRCALNKSNDFDELVDRSQLDISEPYKVYRIIPEGVKRGYIPSYTSLPNQVSGYMSSQDSREWREYPTTEQHPLAPPITHPHGPHAELQYGQAHYTATPSRPWSGSIPENESLTTLSTVDYSSTITDFGLHISLFYREALVKQSQRQGAEKLPDVLEKGVALWMGADGLYAKRLCQGRVFWEGPLAPHKDKPNKLEKEHTCKLWDTQQFLAELQNYAHYGCRIPRHTVVLCFGDEFPDLQRHKKLITAQVEPSFARKLVGYYQEQQHGSQWRSYDHVQEHEAGPPPVHYPAQRPALHHV